MNAPTPCPFCSYDLRGLPDSSPIACPECGRHITIALIPVSLPRRASKAVLAGLLATPIVIAAVSMACVSLGLDFWSTPWRTGSPIGACAGLAWSFGVLRWL